MAYRYPTEAIVFEVQKSGRAWWYAFANGEHIELINGSPWNVDRGETICRDHKGTWQIIPLSELRPLTKAAREMKAALMEAAK